MHSLKSGRRLVGSPVPPCIENGVRKLATVLFIFVTCLPGCMMVRGGNLQPPEQWPPQSTSEKKSINLTVTAKASSQQPSNAKVLQLLEGQSQKAYMESGLFSHVAVSKEPTDLRAEVEIIEEGSEALASISGFISGLLLG